MPKAPKAKLGDKVIHPNSRKASQIARRAHRDTRKERSRKDAAIKLNLVGEKVLWFRDNVDPEQTAYTPEATLELIRQYQSRFEDEIEQIEIKNSIGSRVRTHASREDAIRHVMEGEREEFRTIGFEIPDIINKETLEYLRAWNGQLRFLPNIKMKRYKESDLASNKEDDDK